MKNDENMVMTFFYLNNSTLSITMDNLVANNFKDQLTEWKKQILTPQPKE